MEAQREKSKLRGDQGGRDCALTAIRFQPGRKATRSWENLGRAYTYRLAGSEITARCTQEDE